MMIATSPVAPRKGPWPKQPRGGTPIASTAMSDVASRSTGDDRLYFRQLLAGMDIADGDPIATQMVNFVYLIGDRETGEAVAVDLAYDIDGALDLLAADDMRLTGVLATHYHADHVGGDLWGHRVPGAVRAPRAHVGADPRAARRSRVGRALGGPR